jgi:hypothetical membrane protein
MLRRLVLLGVLAYVVTVILGAALQPGYSHLYNTISELTVAHAPNKLLMGILFDVYNVSLVFYGVLGMRYQPERKSVRRVFILIATSGLIGLLLYFFTQDARGETSTLPGVLHIVLAACLSVITLVACALSARAFRIELNLPRATPIAWILFGFIFITGGITFYQVSQNLSLGGLFERLTIGGFLAWLIFFAWTIPANTSHNESTPE